MKSNSLSKKASPYDCIDEFPLHWVRANQSGIFLCIVLSVVTQQFWVLAVALAVQLAGRLFGIRYNLFVRLISPILPKSKQTESRELLRFNNLLAILFLVCALVAFALEANVIGYIITGFLTAAVVLALAGFCVGCFIYFQWKQYWLRRHKSQ